MELFWNIAGIIIVVLVLSLLIAVLITVFISSLPERPKKLSRKQLEWTIQRLLDERIKERDDYMKLFWEYDELKKENQKLKQTPKMPKPKDGKWEKGK